ncbi:16S rRNA (guanine(966)-N(2))-methyltransferase RsmD [Psychrobacter arenosus]|uniref:16S rRNA (guanine(966)-N(2))-methyltransferase RsmD n=1 Tax=Psychrobacter arenosus TaxID=256326 RepID=UPI001919842F|nr:16S rRNA (guanine(966)-N(2))-methyltransferase RsmD [Psychrobacter arenosus]
MSKKSARSSRLSTSKHYTATSAVRIIGGRFKRRQLDFIDAEGLRPTPDRLRETLFSWLMADLYSARVLDCCAGSGVLGFEALSRGAAHCTFIEANPKQSQLLADSAELLQVSQTDADILTGRAELVIEQQAENFSAFDVVFIDPPYELDLWQPILKALLSHQLIHSDTLLYLEADRPINDIVTVIEKAAKEPTATIVANDNLDINNDTDTVINSAEPSFYCLKETKVGQIHAGIYQYAVNS